MLMCSRCKAPITHCDSCSAEFKKGDNIRCISMGYGNEHSHDHIGESSGGRSREGTVIDENELQPQQGIFKAIEVPLSISAASKCDLVQPRFKSQPTNQPDYISLQIFARAPPEFFSLMEKAFANPRVAKLRIIYEELKK